MHDKFQYYRQPMVTATSIFLGFMLNVGYNWGGHAFESRRLKDGFVAVGLCLCSILLVTVLYRILNMNYPRDKAETYYRTTLFLFIGGLAFAFLTIGLVMIESFALHRG